ncbi:MAG: DUF2946 family protein [Planctomycetaceae bacterium]|nr:DUF2946 family protein [Planctomycetaceae bacterium]
MRGAVRHFALWSLTAWFAVLWAIVAPVHRATCGHEHSTTDCSDEVTPASHHSAYCSHHHAHSHSDQTPEEPADSSHHEHCRFCELFSQPVVQAAAATIAQSFQPLEILVAALPGRCDSADRVCARSRGPPSPPASAA